MVRISKKYELIEFITKWNSWIKQLLIYIENMPGQPKILVLFQLMESMNYRVYCI